MGSYLFAFFCSLVYLANFLGRIDTFHKVIALVAVFLSTQGIILSLEEQEALVVSVLAIVNIALRIVTKEPVQVP